MPVKRRGRKSKIERDFRVAPVIYFRKKADALRAQKQAKKYNILTRLGKFLAGYKLTKKG